MNSCGRIGGCEHAKPVFTPNACERCVSLLNRRRAAFFIFSILYMVTSQSSMETLTSPKIVGIHLSSIILIDISEQLFR